MESNLLRFLHLDLARSPGNDVEINDRVENEKQIHRRDREEVNDAGDDTPEFLWMETGCYKEGTR